MQLRLSHLNRQVLRTGPSMFAGAAIGALLEQALPADWLLLLRTSSGYVVTNLEALQRRLRDDPQLLSRQLRDLDLPVSPALELDSTLEQAEALAQRTGYAVIERAGEAYGVVRPPHLALGQPNLERLRDLLAGWQPPKPGGVLSDAEVISRDLSPAPAPQLETLPQRDDRYINTDFAGEGAPGQPLDRKQPLQQGRAYYFRVHVGEAEASSIEATPALLPALVLRETVDLRVVIFSEDFELSEDTGVLRVPTDDPASVAEPASTPAGIAAGDPLLAERLFFLVRVPGGKRGVCSLRVNIYRNSMLVQSRLVRARVGAGRPLAESGAQLVSTLDYNLSPALAPGHLGAVAPHKLSLMLNSNDDETHAFRLVGQQGQELFSNSAVLSIAELNNLIEDTRGVLRRTAWGKAEPWAQGMEYRYDIGTSAETIKKNFAADLVNLAVRGTLTYNALKNALGRGPVEAKKLRDLMRQPGIVQLASKISANDVVPIAMFYDWPLDTRAEAALTICEAFEASVASGQPLISEPCFLGDCPHREDLTVICPSGFWGFRHDIGMPWSPRYGPELATQISYTGTPLLDAALNQEFPALPGHLNRLGGLGFTMQSKAAREDIFTMFKETQPQVIYFYCHGVLNGTTPTLKVGPPQAYIDTSNFDSRGITWPEARPLVFMNGCHTTALSPSQALSFVRTFIEDVAAAGVVGTEITIFEPLAQTFAETFLPLFAKGIPFGRAIREARLALLAQRNPLGLVYHPYAYSGLRLVAR